MKLKYNAEKVLGSAYALQIVSMLLNFLDVNTRDINSYNELTKEEKEVVSQQVFELVLRENTLSEKIEKLFKEFKAEKFGFISGSEKAFIEKSLGLSDKLSVEELTDIRNEIVRYTDRLLNGSEITLSKRSQLAIVDKMSAFVCVIDRIKIQKRVEV